ncbi:NMT1/THI5 like-domain-containing protein [Haematococcus lacustris]
MAARTSVTIALDWTPNCNHTGFYLAKAQGLYRQAGLDVTITSPHVDEYHTTPLSHVADKSATFGICPSESVISYHTWPDASKPKVVALAAVLQGSTSAVVTLKSSGITRPSQLDGKTYASYGARYEGRIVQQLIRNDGGTGDFKEVTPPMLGIWNTLLKGEADATWVFLGWEGVEARMKGVELNCFGLEEFRVPYGYSPLLVAHPDTLRDQPEVVRAFLAATSQAFAFAAADPAEAARQLLQAVAQEHAGTPLPVPLDPDMVKQAQEFTSQHYLDAEGRWGVQQPQVWTGFISWLTQQGLLTSKVQSRSQQSEHHTSLDGLRQGDVGAAIDPACLDLATLFTNDFLPQPGAVAV